MKSDRSNRNAASFIALGCVGFIASAPMAAQAQEEATRLEGVTVTDSAISEGYGAAEVSSPKSTAPLLDTPRTVNVITEEVLQDTASFSFEEALRTVPGITLGAGEGGVASADIPFIRGIDATGDVFVDGARDVGSQTRDTFSLEALEVAKGPSSAFGGRGTAAGAINLITKTARAGNFGSGDVTVGTENFVRATADANVDLGNGIAMRMVGMVQDADVAGRDEVYDNRWGVMPSITFGVGSDISASFTYYHYETDAMPDYGLPLTGSFGTVRRPADTDPDNFYGLVDRDFQDTKTDAVTMQLDAYLGSGITLSNTTRYNRNTNHYVVTNPDDSKGNVVDGNVYRGTKSRGSLNDGWTSNTNLSALFETGSIEHSLSGGFEFSISDSTNRGYSVNSLVDGVNSCPDAAFASGDCTTLDNPDPNDAWTGNVTRSTRAPSVASADEYSLYLFDTVTLTPQFLLNGGIRWTSFKATGAGAGRGGAYDAKNKGDYFTWQGGAIFKPSEQTSLYASYANSKTPPGATVGEGAENIGGGDDLLKPQAYENWEVGAKAELFDGNLLLSGALYRVDRDNVLEITDDSVDSYEAGRLQGIELSAAGQIGPVSLVAGYTLVDSEIRDDAVLHDDDPSNDSESTVGNTLPQTPKHNFSATVDWEVTPAFSIGGGAYGASKRYADGKNLVSSDGYVRFDAHAAYQINETVGLRLNVQNIGDKRYIVKLRNPHFAVPAAGRRALVTLTARY
ncbi:TonB-dependent siderophore receptor [Altericroceibacterium endophyticum]|uniref:TonB-dependent receptor n=1 Tax=Altericroceibacterium endophyticum TaxID=1808508 RepID=UPI00301BEA83